VVELKVDEGVIEEEWLVSLASGCSRAFEKILDQ
jgi:hypothetical protein